MGRNDGHPFAPIIRRLMREHHVNSSEIDGFSQPVVNNWMCGKRKPSFESLWGLHDFFGVPFDVLMGAEQSSGIIDNRSPKRCPFCGSRASVRHMDYGDDERVWGVFCEADLADEYSHGHYIDNYQTREEAIRAWNSMR